MKKTLLSLLSIFLPLTSSWSYPLDDYTRTGIDRLEGYCLSLQTPSGKAEIVPGARLLTKDIRLSLPEAPLKDFPSVNDKIFTSEVKQLLRGFTSSSAFSVLDFSDLNRIRLAEWNGNLSFVPGSLGKVFIASTILRKLATIHPGESDRRERVLRSKEIHAGDIVEGDSHVVPFWNRQSRKLSFREMNAEDDASLWTYLDWMVSSSSNAAASSLLRETALLEEFAEYYPPDTFRENNFLNQKKPHEIGSLVRKAAVNSLWSQSFPKGKLFQASAFTKNGRKQIASKGSTATTNALIKLFFDIERGKFIDYFSSIELKRILYLTQKRIRLVASASLDSAAVYFKSGSLYSCYPERGYQCEKFLGNSKNYMNSVALVEWPAKDPQLRFIVALHSNTPKTHSAEFHERFGDELLTLLKNHHGIEKTTETKEPTEIRDAPEFCSPQNVLVVQSK